jgi:hypothetical protein
VRISREDGSTLSVVYLALDEAEAQELMDALAELRAAAPGWHAHVPAADGQTEITVYRDDDATAAF